MTINKISEINQGNIEFKKAMTQEDTTLQPILQFAVSKDNGIENSVSDAKIITENFKSEILNKLETAGLKIPTDSAEYYLNKLIESIQVLNGVQKNNLIPQGNTVQNETYNKRINETISLMNDYVKIIDSGLGIIKDSKTGLYKLSINEKLYDVPERKVEMIKEQTEDGIELMPKIVD